jgi:hypothetical protein
MLVRAYLSTAAAVCLIANSFASAQTPPAAAESEQRLKALEDKMDRVLKALEARPTPQPPATSTPEAMRAARDVVRAALKAKMDEYQEFVRNSPVKDTNRGRTRVFAERLGKYEARRSELKIKRQEMTDQLARIENALKEQGNQAAGEMIRRLGVSKLLDDNPAQAIVERLNRERLRLTADDKHANVADIDEAIKLVRKIYAGRDWNSPEGYIAMIKEEVAMVTTAIDTLSDMIAREAKTAHDTNAFEVQEERLRTEIDRLRNALKVLESLAAGDGSQ